MNPNSRFSRIFFLEPGVTSNFFHCNIFQDALNLDVREFCNAMLSAAQNWLAGAMGTQLFQTNYAKFLRRYPNGLPPYVVGIPVIG
jgi:hypothetical protein